MAELEPVSGQMGQGLPEHPEHEGGLHAQELLHVSELPSPHPVDDLHDELDRAAAEGLPACDPDAGRTAERGVRPVADGQDRHGQGRLRQGPAMDGTDIDKKCGPEDARTQKTLYLSKS